MYKLLLCWRYLLTRYIALASIVSVMLGVAAMIVVNAVMCGFIREMESRLHGILSDVIFESRSLSGFQDAQWHMEQIRSCVGDRIEGLTPTVVVPAMMSFPVGPRGEMMVKQVDVVGVDELTQGKVSEIAKYLQHPENRKQLSFTLRDGGYDTVAQGNPATAAWRPDMENSGWRYRIDHVAEVEKLRRHQREENERHRKQQESTAPLGAPSPQPVTATASPIPSPFAPEQPVPASPPPMESSAWGDLPATVVAGEPQMPDFSVSDLAASPFVTAPSKATEEKVFDPAKEQHPGAIVGFAISQYDRIKTIDPETGQERVLDKLCLIPGDDIMLTIPMGELPPKLQLGSFTVVDLFESKMMDHDMKLVFVPIKTLQDLRGMFDPQTGQRMVSQILIKAKPGEDLRAIRDAIREHFPNAFYSVRTWTDVQEALLAAVFMEVTILNVLLFLVIAVAGFGILAIFFMIVVEKTKDIGILKSLGAGSTGVMQVFLYYSLALGIVGSGGGMLLGLLIVRHIKEIAEFLSRMTGHNVFDPAIYSFYEVPTIVEPLTVFWIVSGAVLIAVAAGVLPAVRAARMHPVVALRS